MKGMVLMAKSSSSKKKHTKRPLNRSNFRLEKASPTQHDANRYLNGRNRLVYSNEVIRDKNNGPQIREVHSCNIEIQLKTSIRRTKRRLLSARHQQHNSHQSKNQSLHSYIDFHLITKVGKFIENSPTFV